MTPPEPAQPIEIKNFDVLKDALHKCTSAEILTDIQVNMGRSSEQMIHMSSCFVQLNARFEEQNTQLMAFMNDAGNRIRVLEVAAGRHECKKDLAILELTKDAASLKMQMSKYEGEGKWLDRMWGVVQAVGIALILAIVIWFMKGGAIT